MKRRVLPLLLCVGSTCLFLFPYLVGHFPFTGDIRDVFFPLEAFYHTSLLAHSLPLWDPQAALGFPVFASAQLGFFAPLLFPFHILPPVVALRCAFVALFFAFSYGTYLYARCLSLSRAGSLLTALSWTFGGSIVGHLTHLNILLALAWLPWLLLVAHRLAITLAPVYALLFGILGAASILSGHLQIPLFSLALAALVCVWTMHITHHFPFQHTLWTSVLFLGAAGVIAITLSAVQLLPTKELLHFSSRADGFDTERANQYSFLPYQAVTYLVPAFYGFRESYWGIRQQVEMAAWIGAVPFLLATASLRLRKTPLHRMWLWIGGVSFLLALGRWSPFRLFHLEPTLGYFSSPARYTIFTSLALALCSGIAFDALRKKSSSSVRRLFLLLSGAVLAIIGSITFLNILLPTWPLQIAAALLHTPHDALPEKISVLSPLFLQWGFTLTNPFIALSTGSILFCAFAVVPFSRSRFFAPLFLSAVSLELVVLGWQVAYRPSFTSLATPQTVSFLQNIAVSPSSPLRLWSERPPGDTGKYFSDITTHDGYGHEALVRDTLPPLFHTLFGFSGIEWPAALDLQNAAALMGTVKNGGTLNTRLLDELGVRAILSTNKNTSLCDVLGIPEKQFASGDGGDVFVWQRFSAKPRFDLRGPGTIAVETDTPLRTVLNIENRTRGLLTLLQRDTWYPGWRALVDGKNVPLQEEPPFFRGIRITPGQHTVSLSYHPTSFFLGATISFFSTCIVLVLFLLSWKKRRRSAILRTALTAREPSL